MAELDKAEVWAALRAQVAGDLVAATESQRAIHEGATHEESRPENDKDTRAVEASYLARGLAQRVVELTNDAAMLARLSPRPFPPGAAIAAGALVSLEDEDGRQSWYLLAPAGGGRKISLAGRDVMIVTPRSPLGEALLGRCAGEEVEVRSPRGLKEACVLAVS